MTCDLYAWGAVGAVRFRTQASRGHLGEAWGMAPER